MPSPPLLPLAVLGLLLTGCHSKADDAAATSVVPVQQGTVSDAMLPVDKVTSTPPLADPEEAADTAAGGGTAKAQGHRGKAAAKGGEAADAGPQAAGGAAAANSGE